MIPSRTVEDYLKAILLGQTQLGDDQRLLPIGEVAAALGVSRSTATGMVKALAKSDLVEYERYTGVRLSPAGLRLAVAVLRRHRLIELFLVPRLGMRWDEVHNDAERLEHVVSDRLLERIDEVLGHPAVNQYGEPIPTGEGELVTSDLDTLLTCPLGKLVTIRLVTDHDAAFLRFIESHDLKPGQSIEVEARDEISGTVRLKGERDQRITIGTRAATKLLVEAS